MLDAEVLAVLDEKPALRRPSTQRALGELIAHERTRQEARMAALRRLRGDAVALLDTGSAGATRDDNDDDEDGRPTSALGRVTAALRARRSRRTISEDELRTRYEEAQLRARRAAAFAEALAALQGELTGELERLHAILVDLSHDENTLDALHGRVRKAAADVDAARQQASGASASTAGARLRELDALAERAQARANALESERSGVRDAEDRLLGLVEGERMLSTRLAHLRHEVDAAAREATRRLDDVADALRSLVTAEDSKRVLADLEKALRKLLGSLDDSARRARDALDESKS